MFATQPRSLADASALSARRAMLGTAPNVQPLREWSADLGPMRDAPVPDFDPADAGVAARVLFLLEAAPMPAHGGSGFISCDNDDATAETTWRARDAAGLHAGVVHWNVVPWALERTGSRPKAADVNAGSEALVGLLDLLPDLRVVVLAGSIPQSGWRRHVAPVVGDRYLVVPTCNPSPRNMSNREMRLRFYADVAAASDYVNV